MKFAIRKDSGIPVYRQIAIQLKRAIDTGLYVPEERLPTETQLYDMTGVSKGTIKAAYRCLEEAGYIRKVRGSGVYVSRPTGEKLESEAAQLANEMYANILNNTTLTATKIYYIAREELGKIFDDERKVRAAFLDCTPEVRAITQKQLSAIERLQVDTYDLDGFIEGETPMEEGYDFVLTTQTHFAEVQFLLTGRHLKIIQLGVSVRSDTVAEITKIFKGRKIGIVYRSEYFLDNICKTLLVLNKSNEMICSHESSVSEVFKDVDLEQIALIVPPDFKENCTKEANELVAAVQEAGGDVILFEYLIDRGTMMHLENKVRRNLAEI